MLADRSGACGPNTARQPFDLRRFGRAETRSTADDVGRITMYPDGDIGHSYALTDQKAATIPVGGQCTGPGSFQLMRREILSRRLSGDEAVR